MIKSLYKDILRDILFMSGIDIHIHNSICSQCLSNADHSRHVKCRLPNGNIDPLKKFYCNVNYYKQQDITPPEHIQHIMLIVTHLNRYVKEYNQLPPLLPIIEFRMITDKTGSSYEKSAQNYRIQLLQLLSKL